MKASLAEGGSGWTHRVLLAVETLYPQHVSLIGCRNTLSPACEPDWLASLSEAVMKLDASVHHVGSISAVFDAMQTLCEIRHGASFECL